MTAESINAATMALKKALIERALGGEMNHILAICRVLPSALLRRTSPAARVPRQF
jgi:hypothetical protein